MFNSMKEVTSVYFQELSAENHPTLENLQTIQDFAGNLAIVVASMEGGSSGNIMADEDLWAGFRPGEYVHAPYPDIGIRLAGCLQTEAPRKFGDDLPDLFHRRLFARRKTDTRQIY